MDDSAPKMKARIISVGLAWPHEPDEHGRIWSATNWNMDGGDFPGADFTAGQLGGWTMAELALLSYIARVADHDEALQLADEYRCVPVASLGVEGLHLG